MKTELIVVLDMDTRKEALAAVTACETCDGFKIGAQLFTRLGPSIVRDVQKREKKVFLDLKYHDIPNTVARAAEGAMQIGASMFNVHALGGRKMMEETVSSVQRKAAATGKTAPRIFSVASMNISYLSSPAPKAKRPASSTRTAPLPVFWSRC